MPPPLRSPHPHLMLFCATLIAGNLAQHYWDQNNIEWGKGLWGEGVGGGGGGGAVVILIKCNTKN
jgi:hypothetical protein